ncbi:MAG: CTP synthase [Firmicutes bacterium]|nr:CTP synthase [Bacillota bacterium]
MAKFIFVTGGVVSSLGKGITAASLGCLLKSRGLKVTMQKIDPYINVDPGNMSPFQHGEVFVTDDGAECDLDVGHYERFIDENLKRSSNITSGKIYGSVINKERAGVYQGATVQVIPHVTNEIKERICQVAQDNNADVAIVEIGGTVGDIESLPFLEAIRQLKTDLGRDEVLYIHVTLVPYLATAGELKTKPTQHSVKELRSIGIQPDIIVCRTAFPLSREIREKIALFCDISPDAVIENLDADILYEVPLMMARQGLDEIALHYLCLKASERDITPWEKLVQRARENGSTRTTIALVGKYVALHDAYLSVAEALHHAGISEGTHIDIRWINSQDLDCGPAAPHLSGVQGILIPSGFRGPGIEGKIKAIQYARENKIPFLGISLGMQMAVVEFARHACGLPQAHSTYHRPHTSDPVVHLPQTGDGDEAPMCLGRAPIALKPGTQIQAAYGEDVIYERHRHRYEVNNDYRRLLEEQGLIFSGHSPDGCRIEALELPGHPFFVATIFHPEFKSRPIRPHPIFKAFIQAAKNK